MKRSSRATIAACAALVLLTACGSGKGGPDTKSPSPGGGSASFGAPAASRSPAAGKGSKDPDDLNGDGYRDLLLPVEAPGGEPQWEPADERILVVYGSAHGLDPVTRSVWGRSDLGLPAAKSPSGVDRPEAVDTPRVAVADLDGDGFPDLTVPVLGQEDVDDGKLISKPTASYVIWGSAHGPGRSGRKPTKLRLPPPAAALGFDGVVRGDFDGDGHHDLAGLEQSGTKAWLLYGPFDRSTGAPARTGTLPASGGMLYADDIDPTGDKPHVTALLMREGDDGEQAHNMLYTAPATGKGRELVAGSAHAFGDFDGDGRRDVVVGDNGSRNDEPGAGTEEPEVDHAMTMYPGDGGAPVRRELPRPGQKGFRAALVYAAADPDGDGRDGVLVATEHGVALLNGTDEVVELDREGPARGPRRHALPYTAADFDGDGRDELVLAWSADSVFAMYGENPTHWWITEGTSGRDRAAFDATAWVKRRPYASPSS
ncbi:FG-GAP repeat domain-containing protein [Streptomyces endophyticus]|uniref:VCBS repeat-containing protein n=1 Tax=Streptomyces endophyticus TaxID=714166 RepID=A0ABU6FGA1_9ACTN|nr:VCBS repeat-containing protein [Streptomyces endophyticus]MEB8343086.1 VCBS repeat-containing protein [Streptomyces endophyticus]